MGIQECVPGLAGGLSISFWTTSGRLAADFVVI